MTTQVIERPRTVRRKRCESCNELCVECTMCATCERCHGMRHGCNHYRPHTEEPNERTP